MTFPVPFTRGALGDDWRREVLLARLRALSDDGRLLLLAHMAGSFPATLEVALTRFEGDMTALEAPEMIESGPAAARVTKEDRQ